MRGGYALVFELPAELQLAVGKKHFDLKSNVYVYSGSALSGVEQRVMRDIVDHYCFIYGLKLGRDHNGSLLPYL